MVGGVTDFGHWTKLGPDMSCPVTKLGLLPIGQMWYTLMTQSKTYKPLFLKLIFDEQTNVKQTHLDARIDTPPQFWAGKWHIILLIKQNVNLLAPKPKDCEMHHI